jgi:nitrite reductase (NADH) small subunit
VDIEGIKAANIGEIPPGRMKVVDIEDKSIMICNVAGKLHAIDSVCPHRGALLGQGTLDGTTITCPWHQWQFDVTTGKGITNPFSSVQAYSLTFTDPDIILTPNPKR